ncbi:hypothetical protein ACIBQ1_26435 [Nonomuraea sp. NPDC050153]|uniref:hypothetical protein n=1 Tax=Nonomuraea sp. NPDC050153 TaxID=3364359 RepID=UPI0037972F36
MREHLPGGGGLVPLRLPGLPGRLAFAEGRALAEASGQPRAVLFPGLRRPR